MHTTIDPLTQSHLIHGPFLLCSLWWFELCNRGTSFIL